MIQDACRRPNYRLRHKQGPPPLTAFPGKDISPLLGRPPHPIQPVAPQPRLELVWAAQDLRGFDYV